MLFIPLQLLLKLGLILLTWRGLSGSCGSAEGDRLDFPPSWDLSADTEQVWLLLRHWINRGKKRNIGKYFSVLFLWETPLNITDMCCKPSATLEGQPLLSAACSECLCWLQGKALGTDRKTRSILYREPPWTLCEKQAPGYPDGPLGLIKF